MIFDLNSQSSKVPPDGAIPASSGVAGSGAPSSVHDRIIKFESMRNRPVPPPPLDFIRRRVKRKPPPPPPPSFPAEAIVPRCAPHNENRDRQSGVLGVSVSSSVDIGNANDLASFQTGVIPDVPSLFPCPRGQEKYIPSHASPGLTRGHTSMIPSDSPVTPGDAEVSHTLPPETSHHAINDLTTLALAANLHGSLDQMAGTTPATPDTAPHSTDTRAAETTLSQYTDLDVLLSRLDDASSGDRYEVFIFPPTVLSPQLTTKSRICFSSVIYWVQLSPNSRRLRALYAIYLRGRSRWCDAESCRMVVSS
jgi:hypothetical protein